MFVVFDLDGTLALTEHRNHHLEKDPKDWDAFHAACGDDAPNWPVIAVYNALAAAGARVVIWTGRSSAVGNETMEWLIRHQVGAGGEVNEMVMRNADDFRSAQELKGVWLSEEPEPPHLAFDDNPGMVKWWREQGVVCMQVV